MGSRYRVLGSVSHHLPIMLRIRDFEPFESENGAGGYAYRTDILRDVILRKMIRSCTVRFRTVSTRFTVTRYDARIVQSSTSLSSLLTLSPSDGSRLCMSAALSARSIGIFETERAYSQSISRHWVLITNGYVICIASSHSGVVLFALSYMFVMREDICIWLLFLPSNECGRKRTGYVDEEGTKFLLAIIARLMLLGSCPNVFDALCYI